MIDKSTRQHYAIQGGGPNYLGKQKMVTAPKKWKSSPDHEPAELAYITKKEKDILLDLNLYGSLKNGKPNRGPSGIISLQGDMGGYGGTGGGGGGNGGGNPNQDRAREAAIQAANKAAQDRAAASMREQAAQRSREEAAQKVAEQKAAEQEAKSKELGAALHGPISPTKASVKTDTSMVENMIAGPIQGIINQPPKDERVPDFVKETITPTTPLRTRIQDDRAEDIRKKALGDIALQTDKSLINVSDPSKKGIMGTLIDSGKNQLKKRATNFALNKLGLGFLNPVLGIASMLGYDPINKLMSKMPTETGTNIDFGPSKGGDLSYGQGQSKASSNVIEASIQKFTPDQMNMIKQRHSQLQGVINSGTYQGRQLTSEEIKMLQEKSLDIQKIMDQYLVNPDELGLARGGLAGLHG